MMYSRLSESVLDWQSLTVEFLPRTTVSPVIPTNSDNSDTINIDMILGTYTSGEEQNHLMLGSVKFSDKGKGMIDLYD